MTHYLSSGSFNSTHSLTVIVIVISFGSKYPEGLKEEQRLCLKSLEDFWMVDSNEALIQQDCFVVLQAVFTRNQLLLVLLLLFF